MKASWKPGIFTVIAAMAIGAVVFRVSSAPERIKARRDTARASCVSLGGSWVREGRDEICRMPEQKSHRQDEIARG